MTRRQTYQHEQDSAQQRMARNRAVARDLTIPSIKNPRRRRNAERDPELWLRTYQYPIFYNPFSRSNKKLIRDAQYIIDYGGKKADSEPRGEGKSSILCGLTTKAIATGKRAFVVVIPANATEAERRHKIIKLVWEKPDKYPELAEDYPEISIPVLALRGTSKGAETQTVGGERTFLQWSNTRLVYPTVPGSKAAGATVFCAGIEGGLRGLSNEELRPDLVLIDDVETRQSVRSQADTGRIIETIETDIEGLGGPTGNVAMFMACTIAKRHCVADRYTDRKVKPAWNGDRSKMLIQIPTCTITDTNDKNAPPSLWDNYVDLRRAAGLKGDTDARAAHNYYLANRDEMDAGAVVNNEFRFDDSLLPDDSQKEVSALQFCFNKIADTSWSSFRSEYQSEPPEETAPEAIHLTVQQVAGQLSHIPRGETPPDPDLLGVSIDVGGKVLDWAAIAYKNGRRFVIDYGNERVLSPMSGRLLDDHNILATQSAIIDALIRLRDVTLVDRFVNPSTGEIVYPDCYGVDTGWQATKKNPNPLLEKPVYEFIKTCPVGLWRAMKGYGEGQYRQPAKGNGKTQGEGWHRTPQPVHKLHLYHFDADYWKLAVHDGFNTPTDEPGTILLFGDEELPHRDFALHITAEEYQTTWDENKGLQSGFIRKRKENHKLDCSSIALALLSMMGAKTTVRDEKLPAPPPADQPASPQAEQPEPQRKTVVTHTTGTHQNQKSKPQPVKMRRATNMHRY